MIYTLHFVRAKRTADPHGHSGLGVTQYIRAGARGSDAFVLNWPSLQAKLLRVVGDDVELDALAEIGDELGAALAGTAWAEIQARLAGANETDPAHLWLRLEAAELFALPWQYLPVGALRLHYLPHVHLHFEFPSATAPGQPKLKDTPGRVLVVSGRDVPFASFVEALSEPLGSQVQHLADTDPDAVAAHIRQHGPFAALHVLTHGASSGGAAGLELGGRTYSGEQLKQRWGPLVDQIGMVVLSACKGSGAVPGSRAGLVAQSLSQAGFRAVVASNMILSKRGARVASVALYKALVGAVLPVAGAVEAARAALNVAGLERDAVGLQLFTHSESGPDLRPFRIRPYFGLLPLGRQQARFFFGREAEVKAIQHALEALASTGRPTMHVVEGASGTGKSSVVQSGLLPGLDDAGWTVVRSRPARLDATTDARLLTQLDGMRARLGQPGTPGRLLLMDQFEEVFQWASSESVAASATTLSAWLWNLAKDGVWVVVIMRSDFRSQTEALGLDENHRMAQLFSVGEWQHHSTVIVGMSRKQLERAIIGPAERVGLPVEPGLTEMMLGDVIGEPGALPLLADVLDTLWTEANPLGMTRERYRALGRARGALEHRANAVIDSLAAADRQEAHRTTASDEPTHGPLVSGLYSTLEWTGLRTIEAAPESRVEVAWRLLIRLVNPGDHRGRDTRKTALLAELEALDSRAAEVIDRLHEARLIVKDEKDGEPVVEVAHEALIRHWEALQQQLLARRGDLIELDRVERWVSTSGTDLLSRTAAQRIERLLSRADLSVSEHVSRVLRLSRRRHRLEILGVAILGAIIFVSTAVAARLNSLSSERGLRLADQAKVLQAIYEAEDPTERAILLSRVEDPRTEMWTETALAPLAEPIVVDEVPREAISEFWARGVSRQVLVDPAAAAEGRVDRRDLVAYGALITSGGERLLVQQGAPLPAEATEQMTASIPVNALLLIAKTMSGAGGASAPQLVARRRCHAALERLKVDLKAATHAGSTETTLAAGGAQAPSASSATARRQPLIALLSAWAEPSTCAFQQKPGALDETIDKALATVEQIHDLLVELDEKDGDDTLFWRVADLGARATLDSSARALDVAYFEDEHHDWCGASFGGLHWSGSTTGGDVGTARRVVLPLPEHRADTIVAATWNGPSQVLAATLDGRLCAWSPSDLQTGDGARELCAQQDVSVPIDLSEIQCPSRGWVSRLTPTSDGAAVIVSTSEGEGWRWTPNTQHIQPISLDRRQVNAELCPGQPLCLSPNGHRGLVLEPESGAAVLVDNRNGQETRLRRRGGGSVERAAWIDDEFVVTLSESLWRVWRVQPRGVRSDDSSAWSVGVDDTVLTTSRDGVRRLVYSPSTGNLTLWSGDTATALLRPTAAISESARVRGLTPSVLWPTSEGVAGRFLDGSDASGAREVAPEVSIVQADQSLALQEGGATYPGVTVVWSDTLLLEVEQEEGASEEGGQPTEPTASSRVIAGFQSGEVRARVSTGEHRDAYTLRMGGAVRDLLVTASDLLVVLYDDEQDSLVRVLDLESGSPVGVLARHPHRLQALHTLGEGPDQKIVGYCAEGEILTWPIGVNGLKTALDGITALEYRRGSPGRMKSG